MDDLPLGSQLWNISKDKWLLSDLALFSVKEDQVPPICKTLSDKFPIHNFVVAKNAINQHTAVLAKSTWNLQGLISKIPQFLKDVKICPWKVDLCLFDKSKHARAPMNIVKKELQAFHQQLGTLIVE